MPVEDTGWVVKGNLKNWWREVEADGVGTLAVCLKLSTMNNFVFDAYFNDLFYIKKESS